MRRFSLITRRGVGASSFLNVCFIGTSNANINTNNNTASNTISNVSMELNEDKWDSTSKSLMEFLSSVASDLQKQYKLNPLQNNINSKKEIVETQTSSIVTSNNSNNYNNSNDIHMDDGKQNSNISLSQEPLNPVRFILALSAYIRREEQLAELCRSKIYSVRQYYLKVRDQRVRLSSLQRDILLNAATRIIEKREVPLIIAVRLLRPRWPEFIMDVSGSRHHAFILRSLRVWVSAAVTPKNTNTNTKEQEVKDTNAHTNNTEEQKENTNTNTSTNSIIMNKEVPSLTGAEARVLLLTCPRLFSGQVALTGAVVEAALADPTTLKEVENIIQLMWAVHAIGTHAPQHFWRRVLEALARRNRELRDQVSDAMGLSTTTIIKSKENINTLTSEEGDEEGLDKKKKKKKNNNTSMGKNTLHVNVGHVFSGLTTRQLFRVLRVLRKERCGGDVSIIYDFIDKALKNIAFEVEALSSMEDTKMERPVSRQAVTLRVRKTCDLSPIELLSLLSIAGDIGVEFHTSLSKVSEFLLSPMVRFLNREQLMLLTTCVRKTRCDSLLLVQTIIDNIVKRGIDYPSTLALTKAALRTILQKPMLLSHLTLSPFVEHIFILCESYKWSLRASQILDWVELLYNLSRRYAPTSSVGVRIRGCVESFADPLRLMMKLGVVPTSIVSRVLEHTVILGMRNRPQFPLILKLWEERNNLVNTRNNLSSSVLEASLDASSTEGENEKLVQTTTINIKENGDVFIGEVPKAIQKVYDDLIYVYERQMIMRVPLTKIEEYRFCETIERVGLYSILMGADIFKQVHLRRPLSLNNNNNNNSNNNSNDKSHRVFLPPQALSPWVERTISAIIHTRLHKAKISPNSSDEEVKRILGLRQCAAARVQEFQNLLKNSPLLLTRQQREVWEYARELAKRFGNAEAEAVAREKLVKALY